MGRQQIRITGAMFVAALSPGKVQDVVILDGLPKGARVVDARYDGFTDTLHIAVEHESFPDCAEGDVIPHREITMGRELREAAVT